MKTCFWLLLATLTLGGCAPGYYDSGSAYRESDYRENKKWYQNAETDEERVMRIWRESASH